MFCDNKDNCDHRYSQHNPGTNTINPQTFAVDEQDNTPLSSAKNEIVPAITGVTTPSQQNKQYLVWRTQAIYKCELYEMWIDYMRSKTESLTEFADTKISNLNDQQKFFWNAKRKY